MIDPSDAFDLECGQEAKVQAGMSAKTYRTAIATLGLSQLAAGRWLGVSPKTAQRYAVDGPSGPAARAVGMAVALVGLSRYGEPYARQKGRDDNMVKYPNGPYVRHSDLTAALDLPK